MCRSAGLRPGGCMRRYGIQRRSNGRMEAARALVFLAFFGMASLLAPSIGAQTFSQTYGAATCNGGALASDPVGDENPSRIDAVGNDTYAAAFYANDSSFYYMRQRLAGDPTGPAGYASHAWSWGIDTDGNEANGFELVASLEGVSELVTLSSAGSGASLWSESTSTHANATVAGSSVGGGTDWFLTIAVPLQEIERQRCERFLEDMARFIGQRLRD